nr:glycoprotein B [Bovine gammaherpesvirus 4]
MYYKTILFFTLIKVCSFNQTTTHSTTTSPSISSTTSSTTTSTSQPSNTTSTNSSLAASPQNTSTSKPSTDNQGTSTPTIPTVTDDTASKNFYKYRVCSASSSSGELFRFDLDQTCPDTKDKKHVEGILLVLKKNIVPYIFKVRKYRKIATSVTVYRGWSQAAVTNRDDISRAIPYNEISMIDRTYHCFSAMATVINGILNTYIDRDSENKSVPLQPVAGLTENINRYFSQPLIYAEPGWFPGIYRVRTTVNCEVVDMYARSVEPYTHFITALGDTIEISPFCHNNSQCTTGNSTSRDATKVWIEENHQTVDYERRGHPTKEKRIFLKDEEYTISWKAEDRERAICDFVIWKTFPRAIQTIHNESFHFVANEVTASFLTSNQEETELRGNTEILNCMNSTINETLEETVKKFNKSHIRDGEVKYYKTNGGLFLIWQAMKPLNLSEHTNYTIERNNKTGNKSRQKRSVDTKTFQGAKGLSTAQVQYAYDHLRTSMNHILEELTKTWCREQKKDNLMWYELSKINPVSVMAAIYGKPVAVKAMGDAFMVSECINVDQASVNIHKSMRTDDPKVCYSRPLVTFKFVNSTATFRGQLGTRNEILLTNTHVETCRPTADHYFFVKNMTHYFKDYKFVKTMDTNNISTLDTFLTLNLTFIDNIDFKTVELYSETERKMASALDLETMFREYNYYTQKLASLREDLDNTIDLNRDRLVKDLSEMMADLGDIGKVVVNTFSGIVTVFGSIVGGFVSFFTNPIGGVTIILLLIVVVFVVFIVSRRTNNMNEAPIKMIYPNIDKASEQENIQPLPGEEIKRILLGMHQLQQSEHGKSEEEASHKPGLFQLLGDGLQLLRRRGYTRLPTFDPSPGNDTSETHQKYV